MYKSYLNKLETQKGINKLETIFKKELSNNLNITLVNGPLFVRSSSGFNDALSGVESPLLFAYHGKKLEVVQSLAKWKRFALKEFDININQGIFVEMNAIRPDENFLTPYHSLHVEQYDWEKRITKNQRNLEFLFDQVNKIYAAIYTTKRLLKEKYDYLNDILPEKVKFISAEELLEQYSNLVAEKRERAIAKKHQVVFIYKIGHKLSNNTIHSLRAPDYDDWNLNGDLIVWDTIREEALELSSMGIRVDANSLLSQQKISNVTNDSYYHDAIKNNEFSLSIGGGIGRTRISYYILEKHHIGEIQATFWPTSMLNEWIIK